jgi:hypothetical protein
LKRSRNVEINHITGAALALSAACILPPVCIDEALAQSAPLYINAVDIDIVHGQIDNYLAALKENGAASVHEPAPVSSTSRCRKRIRTTFYLIGSESAAP